MPIVAMSTQPGPSAHLADRAPCASGPVAATAWIVNLPLALPCPSASRNGWAASCGPHPSGPASRARAHSDRKTFPQAGKPRTRTLTRSPGDSPRDGSIVMLAARAWPECACWLAATPQPASAPATTKTVATRFIYRRRCERRWGWTTAWTAR